MGALQSEDTDLTSYPGSDWSSHHKWVLHCCNFQHSSGKKQVQSCINSHSLWLQMVFWWICPHFCCTYLHFVSEVCNIHAYRCILQIWSCLHIKLLIRCKNQTHTLHLVESHSPPIRTEITCVQMGDWQSLIILSITWLSEQKNLFDWWRCISFIVVCVNTQQHVIKARHYKGRMKLKWLNKMQLFNLILSTNLN